MKRLILGLTFAAAMAGVSGCAGGPFGGGNKMYSAGGVYDAYYDNYYGKIYDGYWSGGTFNYRTAADRPFQQDLGGHFRQDAASGFDQIHGDMHPGAPGVPAGAVTQPPQQ
jgi:hypothetical protein